MSTALVSDLVESIAKVFLRYENTGIKVTPKEIGVLVRNLRTIRELALQLEEENWLLGRQIQRDAALQKRRAEHGAAMPAGENVVRFPVKVRLVPSGGGDAA